MQTERKETKGTIAPIPIRGLECSFQESKEARWHVPIIPALRRLRQTDHELQTSLDYTVRFCLKK
jgi:hypothetical protein